MQVVSFTELRKNLKAIINHSINAHDPIIITRPHGEHMVMLPLTDFEALKETAYLLADPANAEHLRKSITSLHSGKGLEKNCLDIDS